MSLEFRHQPGRTPPAPPHTYNPQANYDSLSHLNPVTYDSADGLPLTRVKKPNRILREVTLAQEGTDAGIRLSGSRTIAVAMM